MAVDNFGDIAGFKTVVSVCELRKCKRWVIVKSDDVRGSAAR